MPKDQRRAIALFSGGLDSMLAVRIVQEQGFEVEALNFQTMFTCCKDTAAAAARRLGVRLTVIGQEDAYIDVVRKPRYGYGKGANPCVDCRIYMFERARQLMEQTGAAMVVSGEVVGQRPMSQKRRDLICIARQSGLEGRLLRPLSALLLPPTEVETSGLIDRQRLYAFRGRSRKGLIALARHFQFEHIPSPSTGCALTEKSFAGKVHDLIARSPESTPWDFDLLKVGRHLRIDQQSKAVVGRREAENEVLARLFQREDSRAAALLSPENFSGPTVLLVGPNSEDALQAAGGLLLRYSKHFDPSNALIRVETEAGTRIRKMTPQPHLETVPTL